MEKLSVSESPERCAVSFKKISIITPSFNQGHFLEQTIDSVLSQNYPSLEYMVIDGGSTDNSLQIIKKYEKHLKFWVSERDRGQSHAINKGFLHCTGDIVNWLNSDDYYEPETFNRVNVYFQQNDIDILLGKSIIFTDGRPENTVAKGGNVFASLEQTIGDSLIDQPSAFFTQEAFNAVYPVNEKLNYLMDRELWIRYLLKNGLDKVLKVDETFVNFRLHGNSKTGSELQSFEAERDSIFLTLAVHTGNKDLADFIQSNTRASHVDIDWLPISADISLNVVFHEYFMVLASERYFRNQLEEVNRFMQRINLSYLSPESAKLHRKITTRLNMIPHPVLKWIKKLKR